MRDIKTSRVLAVRNDNSIVATLGLAPKRPWAIDLKYFQTGGYPAWLDALPPGYFVIGDGPIIGPIQ